MMTLVLCGLALAGPWADANGDIVVERVIDRPRADLFADFTNLDRVRAAAPESCMEEWALGVPSEGVGASARVTYHMGIMRRRLTLTVTKADLEQVVAWDHPEKKGFVTQVVLSDDPLGGTLVKMGTYIQAPPWPFKPYYFTKVHPVWVACYDGLLESLAQPSAQ